MASILRDVPDAETCQAARTLLRSAQDAAAPCETAFENLRGASRILVIRSGGFGTLASFARRVAALDPATRLTVLVGRRDADEAARVCPAAVEVVPYPADGNFAWAVFEATLPELREPEGCGAYVFLANNSTAAGYGNVIEIMCRLSPRLFYAYTFDGRLLAYSKGKAAALRARDRLVAGLSGWFWELLDEGDAR